MFETYPPVIRKKLLALREVIFKTAASTEGVGELEETLKWGQPAYVTAASKSGSTIRVDWKKGQRSQYAMYFHCQTDLIQTFRTRFPSDFTFEGNRAIVFEAAEPVPPKPWRFALRRRSPTIAGRQHARVEQPHAEL